MINGKRTRSGWQRRFGTAISILSIALLLSGLTACKTRIEVLPVSDEEVPVRMLDNGNYEVTPGYVQYHVKMMAQIKVLKAELRELRK